MAALQRNPFHLMYAKLFTQIFDSSIADNWKHRHVFEDMLKLADQQGIVDMTPEAIAARTRMPIEMVKAGIEHLESPDPRSRTKEQEGRRIVRLDPERSWGWLIVNYTKYREIKKQTDRKAYMADYMRKYRQKTAVNSQLAASVNDVNSSPSPFTSVSLEGESEGKPAGPSWEAVKDWLEMVRGMGADFTKEEARAAWLGFNANGWKWGKNPVVDFRSAVESRITSDRTRLASVQPSAQPNYSKGI